MARTKAKSRPKLARRKTQKAVSVAWKVESLRATLFVGTPGSVPRKSVWKKLTGKAPEQINEIVAQNSMQEIGPVEGGQLAAVQQPDRGDLLLKAPSRPQESAKGQLSEMLAKPILENVGSYHEAIDRFSIFVSTWSGLMPKASRLAIGCVLFEELDTEGEVLAQLQSLLPNLPLDKGISVRDFKWEVNKPEMSKVIKTMPINRLMKWSASESILYSVNVSTPDAVQTKSGISRWMIRLEMDINSVPAAVMSIPKTKTKGLYKELIGMAKEIAEQGGAA